MYVSFLDIIIEQEKKSYGSRNDGFSLYLLLNKNEMPTRIHSDFGFQRLKLNLEFNGSHFTTISHKT